MKHHTKNINAQGPLNKLPEGIISRILKCLPLRDAAKLCLVSRSWFRAWKELPGLCFDETFFKDMLKLKKPTADDILKILSLILLSHVGSVSEFYLCIPRLASPLHPDIGPCISYLSRNNVKDITIKNVHVSPCKLPYHLFSCPKLENLKLDNCILNLLPFFEVMRNLKSIQLENVILMGNSFTDFMARCPALESLTLKKCRGFEHVVIVAPNLKYLTVSGKFETFYLRSAENLLDLSITQDESVPNYQTARTCEFIAYLAHPCSIRSLSFDRNFCKFLTAGKIGSMFPTQYRCLKRLQLSDISTYDREEISWVLGMIRSCPVLEDLKISFSGTASLDDLKIIFDPFYQLPCLRKVHLSSVIGITVELTLLEFLLRCSPVLETMCVVRAANIPENLESRLTRKLMCYPRASPKASVVYIDP